MNNEIFLVAGEASADMYGASLVKELRRLNPNVCVWGVGGEALRREGMEIIADAKELSIVGGSDWMDKLHEVVGVYKLVKRAISRRPPEIAILMDLPDFNLMLAFVLRALGTRIVYYISPQVWAWRKYRIRKLRSLVEHMFVVLPFEETFYKKHKIPATFVGHPLSEVIQARTEYRNQEEIVRAPRIAILPGSRRSEIRFHAELVKSTICLLKEQFPEAEVRVPVPATLSSEWVESLLDGSEICFSRENSHEVLRWADVALVASGTATLETAMIGTPLALFYRVSPSSAFLFKRLVGYQGYIGLPNVLMGREIVREFFQEEAIAPALADEISRLIRNEKVRADLIDSFSVCRELAGSVSPSEQVARWVTSKVSMAAGVSVTERALALE